MAERLRGNRCLSFICVLAAVLFSLHGMVAARDLPPLFKWQQARQNERFRSPLIVDGGRVFFLQPDWTLTILDLETGTVLRRDVGARREDWCYSSPDQVEWVVRGRLLLGVGGHYGVVVVDHETGDMDVSYCKWPSNESFPLIYGSEVVLRGKGDEIVFLNQDTLAARRLPHAEFSTCDIVGDRLFVFTDSLGNRKGRLECYAAGTLELLWKADSEPGDYWAAMACLEDAVHVFTKPWSGENDDFSLTMNGRISSILEFDPSGGEPARRVPEEGDFYEELRVLARSFIYKNSRYYYGRLKLELPAATRPKDDRAGLAAKLGASLPGEAILGSVLLPDGKVFGVYHSSRLSRLFSVFLADTECLWEGEIGSVENAARYYGEDDRRADALFSFAFTDKYLLYAGPNGKVECLDRATGKSRWLYACPSFDYRSWHQPYWPVFSIANWAIHEKTFYTSVRREYGDSLNPSLQKGVAINGRADPPTRIVLDPAPMPFPEEELAPVMAWLPPVGTLTLFVCLCLGLARRDGWALSFLPDRRQIVLPSLICLLLCYGSYYYFGRYSAAAMYLQWAAIIVVLLIDLGVMILHPRYIEERTNGAEKPKA